jgi:uncharacterized protein YjbI with pentapeptide repeats
MTQRKTPVVLIAALAISGVILEVRPWDWPWSRAWADLRGHGGLFLTCFAAGLSVARVMAARKRAARLLSAPDGRRWPWLLSYRGVAAATAAVAAVGVIALVIMLELASRTTADRAKLQIDAIKYGLGAFAAAGAMAALLLNIRRQRHLEHAQEQIERAQQHTEFDAAERRTTDLYTRAAEQLGSADAAVRLAGLYALERVAQNNVGQRQSIVNVVCAYLRMPFTPSVVAPGPGEDGPLRELPASSAPVGELRELRQELEVRLAAQCILTAHLIAAGSVERLELGTVLQSPMLAFWTGIDLDLTGATLVDWRLERGAVRQADFTRATFTGSASFQGATFLDGARFDEATFLGSALYGDVLFAVESSFEKATFGHAATFTRAEFSGDARFGRATFGGRVAFGNAAFLGAALFGDARFADDVSFLGASFTNLDEPIPGKTTDAMLALLDGGVDLDGAQVTSARRTHHWPPGWEVVPGAGLERTRS